MMERYPVIREGRIRGTIRTFPDFVEIMRESSVEYYLWRGEYGVRLSPEFSHCLEVWYEPGLGVFGYAAPDFEEYVDLVARGLADVIRGKTAVVNFSGGKDSVVSLAILAAVRERVDFRLYAAYVHMPFLEPPSCLDFAERAAERLGVELISVEAERRRVKTYLERQGLPKKGRRWCTYLKIRGLREARKSVSADFEAKGDRLVEAGKRLRRMYHFLRKRVFVDGSKVNVAYPLTILDVVRITRELGLVHPQYLAGIPRVSCKYCPYKSLYELYASEDFEVEDEGYVEYIARREYQKYYEPLMSWDDFWEQHLWRFSPTAASLLARFKSEHPEGPCLELEQAIEMFRSVWIEPLPELERLTLEDLERMAKAKISGEA